MSLPAIIASFQDELGSTANPSIVDFLNSKGLDLKSIGDDVEFVLASLIEDRLSRDLDMLVDRDVVFCIQHRLEHSIIEQLVATYSTRLDEHSDESSVENYAKKLPNRLSDYRESVFKKLLYAHFEVFRSPQRSYRSANSACFHEQIEELFLGSLAGEEIDGYSKTEFLGRGGFGNVWKATDLTGQVVALKTPRRDKFRTHEQIEHWLEYAKRSSKIRHDCVARVRKVLEHPPCIVMEYVADPTLRDFLASETLSEGKLPTVDEVVAAVVGLSKAILDEFVVDGQRLIHLDLNPSNVFVAISDSGLELKLFDLDMTETAEGIHRSGLNHVPFTRSFVAHEVLAQKDPINISTRAVAVSLAGIMFCLITGHSSFLVSCDGEAKLIPKSLGDHTSGSKRDLVNRVFGNERLSDIYSSTITTNLEQRFDISRFVSGLEQWLDSREKSDRASTLNGFFNTPSPSLGREYFERDELNQLKNLLGTKTNPILISGQAGVGKTSLVTRFAEECLASELFINIFVINGTNAQAFAETLNDVAHKLGFPVNPNESIIHQIDNKVDAPILIIVDDLQAFTEFNSTIGKHLQSSSTVTVVVTTRSPRPDILHDEESLLLISDLDGPESGADFLMQRVKGLDRTSCDKDEFSAASELSDLVSNRMLPLDQLAARLKMRRQLAPNDGFKWLLAQYRDTAMKNGILADRVTGAYGHPQSFTHSIVSCLQALSIECQRLLFFFAQFPEEPINLSVVPLGEELQDPNFVALARDRNELNELLIEAYHASLVLLTEENMPQMHSAVADVLCCRCEEKTASRSSDQSQVGLIFRRFWRRTGQSPPNALKQARIAAGYAMLTALDEPPLSFNQTRHLLNGIEDSITTVFELGLLSISYFLLPKDSRDEYNSRLLELMAVVNKSNGRNSLLAAFAAASLGGIQRHDQKSENDYIGCFEVSIQFLMRLKRRELNRENSVAIAWILEFANGIEFDRSHSQKVDLIWLRLCSCNVNWRVHYSFAQHLKYRFTDMDRLASHMKTVAETFALEIEGSRFQRTSLDNDAACLRAMGRVEDARELLSHRQESSSIFFANDYLNASSDSEKQVVVHEWSDWLMSVTRRNRVDLRRREVGDVLSCRAPEIMHWFLTSLESQRDVQGVRPFYTVLDILTAFLLNNFSLAGHRQNMYLVVVPAIVKFVSFTISHADLGKALAICKHIHAMQDRAFFGVKYEDRIELPNCRNIAAIVALAAKRPNDACPCGSKRKFKSCQIKDGKNHLERAMEQSLLNDLN